MELNLPDEGARAARMTFEAYWRYANSCWHCANRVGPARPGCGEVARSGVRRAGDPLREGGYPPAQRTRDVTAPNLLPVGMHRTFYRCGLRDPLVRKGSLAVKGSLSARLRDPLV